MPELEIGNNQEIIVFISFVAGTYFLGGALKKYDLKPILYRAFLLTIVYFICCWRV